MIPEPSDPDREVHAAETFHEQTDDELTDKEVKQMEADDQSIQTILMGLPEDICVVVDSIEISQEIWLHVQQMMKGYDIGVQEKKAKLFNEWERFTSTDGESIESYYHPDDAQLYDFLKFNQVEVNELRAERLARTHDPFALMANSNNPYNYPVFHQDQPSQIAQPGINMGQDRHMQMVGGNGGNPFRQYAGQNVRNMNGYNAVQNIRNQIANQNGSGNVVAARAEGNGNVNSGNKEEAWIQLQAEEFDLIAAAGDLDEIEEVNANCILMANLQQASTSGTQTDNAPIYDSDGSAELLEPIYEPHQVQQNDSNVISAGFSVEQSGGTVNQHPATVEETHALYDSLYNNLAIEVDKVNKVLSKACLSRAMSYKKTNVLHLSYAKTITTLNEEIANLNNRVLKEKLIVSYLQQENKKLKFDFKIGEDELLDKQIQLEQKIKDLDNILVKTGQSIQMMHMLSPKPDSFYHTEQKMALGYQNPCYLKQAQQKQQSLYNGKVLLENHDPPTVYDSEETLHLAQESRLKMKQLNKEIKPANYAKINQLSEVFVSQKIKSREELYFLNTSKMASVSKSVSKSSSIPNEEFSDDTSPSVARKFLNEVKSTIVTLQSVVKQKMTLHIHNWSSTAHQELQKVVKDEIFPIVNQFDARVQNFEIQFLKEATKFVRDFKSLAKEADESLAKHKSLEYEIECREQFLPQHATSNRMVTNLVGDLKGKIMTTQCGSDTLDPLSQKLEDDNVSLEFQDTTNGTSVNTKFTKQSILGKPPSSSKSKLYYVTPFLKSKVIPKVGETNALSKLATSNSTPSTRESKVVKNDNVIALGMFRINPSKTSRENVNSNSNGISSTRVESTAKIRRPLPRITPKNERNEKSEVICATCKQCLITANHNECMLQYVNDVKSRKKNQSANVSKSSNQEKHKANVNKSKKLGSKESLASPRPSKPRTCLRWLPTGRIFDLHGKINASSNTNSLQDSRGRIHVSIHLLFSKSI
ncbi:hypothetical protein Tco_1133266 [Tanacetum coccineum]